MPAYIHTSSFYHAGTVETHREFGGGLGVRWVTPEEWAAEAGSPSRCLPFDLLAAVVGLTERVVLLRNLRKLSGVLDDEGPRIYLDANG